MFPKTGIKSTGIDEKTDNQTKPIPIWAVDREMRKGIAQGNSNDPLHAERDVGNNFDIFVAT